MGFSKASFHACTALATSLTRWGMLHRRQLVLRANYFPGSVTADETKRSPYECPAHQGFAGRSLVSDDDRLDRGRRGLIPAALGGHRSVGAGDGAQRFCARRGRGRGRRGCSARDPVGDPPQAPHLGPRATARAMGVRDRAPQSRRRAAPSRPAEGRTAREFRGVPGRAGGRGSPCAERCAEAPGDARAASARHRDLDLPRRPVDHCDGEAPVDVRGRGQGGASSRAQVAWRGLAEVDRVKTPELIAALAADPVPEPIRLGRRIVAALAIGFLGSLAIYFLRLGPRPDIAAACDTMRFWLKFVDSVAFALPTFLLTLRLARPDAKPGALALWLVAPFILLAAGVVVELLVVTRSEWMSRLMGATALHCTITIPMLAAPILVALIVALRPGAPLYPGLTGAMAGAAAAGG